MPNLEIKVTRHHCSGKDVAVIALKGMVNSLGELEPTIKDLQAENIVHYIFDFSEVMAINSTGIGFLIKLVAEAQGRHSRVVVIGASERLKIACDLVGLWGFFALADNLEHALKMFLGGNGDTFNRL